MWQGHSHTESHSSLSFPPHTILPLIRPPSHVHVHTGTGMLFIPAWCLFVRSKHYAVDLSWERVREMPCVNKHFTLMWRGGSLVVPESIYWLKVMKLPLQTMTGATHQIWSWTCLESLAESYERRVNGTNSSLEWVCMDSLAFTVTHYFRHVPGWRAFEWSAPQID